MTWQSPERLWLLAAVLVLAVAYVVMQRRRSRYAVRFTNLKLLDRVAPKRPQWRRHVPAGLFLAMLALLILGFARPTDEVRVPRERATVLVAVDVSRSMLADDVDPDRLTAAKAAAREFVVDLPEHTGGTRPGTADRAGTGDRAADRRVARRAGGRPFDPRRRQHVRAVAAVRGPHRRRAAAGLEPVAAAVDDQPRGRSRRSVKCWVRAG
jgi:Ca-activated chloride channel family protein